MRLRYLALAVVLILVLNAGITYGIVQWASPSGAQGPQGVQGEQGIAGPMATADANTLLCAAALSAQTPVLGPGSQKINAEITKYCP
jgi:hypothetical protein